jgi:N-acetylglucosamine-6-phosphate deacetylase
MLSSTMRVLALACRASEIVAQHVVGIHLEGPYISAEDGPRGAHPLEHCRPPCWNEFQRLQEAAEGRIRIITLSPEYEGAHEFIERTAASGVLVAIGHTAANSDQIRAAVDAGARMSTHLGNGAHGQIRRHPNYIWDQLAEDRLVASLIADGHHLPASVVKCFVRAKSPARCILVSDLVGMAGMPPGRYRNTSIGDIEILDDGRLVVAGQRQYLAGAGLPIHYGIPNVMKFAEVPLSTAINMVTTYPARLLDLPAPRIEVGASSELVLFDLPKEPGQPLAIHDVLVAS